MSIKDAVRHAKFKLKHNYSRNIMLGLLILFCFICTYQSIASMSRNWELSETLTREKNELELAKVEVETMELENEYQRTEEYQELMARKLLDKKLPGENMVVMPENSAEALAKHQVVVEKQEEGEKSNFEQWMMYLFPSV